MKAAVFALMMMAAAATANETRILRTADGYWVGSTRVLRTHYGYAVTRSDGTTATITRTDSGYNITESASGPTHPRRATKK